METFTKRKEMHYQSKRSYIRSYPNCRKIRPYVKYYRDQTNSFNHTVHNILTNEIGLILLKYIERKEKHGIITLLISGFIGLVYEGMSSFLHHRRHNTLHKAVKVIENKANMQHIKLMHLEDIMVMYGIYNLETLEKLVNRVHIMQNNTTPNERLFTGDFSTAFTWYVNQRGVNHYAIKTLLYLRTLREKYVKMYEEFIMQLCIYVKDNYNSCKRVFNHISYNSFETTEHFR